jgi:Family of unknown function (DUF5690)
MKHSHESESVSRQVAAGVWAVVAAFGCYFCMYAFRKPFTAANFDGEDTLGLSFKSLLVISQVAGYMVSKFVGVKVIAEMPSHKRGRMIIYLILLAELALLLFAIVPRPWNAICLFLNGLPLGMVFGLVLGHLEGRQSTEALAAGLCTSFILADGVTKSVATWLLNQQVAEHWMPFATGAIFLSPLLVCVGMLSQVRPPSANDIAHRSQRMALDREQRWTLFRTFSVGLVPLIIMYLAVTVMRSIRSDFAPELWRGLGESAVPAIFTWSETYVAMIVLLINGTAVFIRDNAKAFRVSLLTCVLGLCIIVGALMAHQNDLLGNFSFMVLIGQGLYLPYVAVHTTVFERLLAMTRVRGNSGFLLYLADSIGYLGYVFVVAYKNYFGAPGNMVGFFVELCWFSVLVSLICMLVSWVYFLNVGQVAQK